MDGLVPMAGCAGANVVHYESNEVGLVELPSNIADGLTNAQMSSQSMIMMRTKDI